MIITKRQSWDLAAISKDPGRYSKCQNDGELMQLVNLGLIRWIKVGGYEITNLGLAALRDAKEREE